MWDFDPNRSVREYEEQSSKELYFDKFRLDEEYEKQPQLYDKWAKWWGKALLLRKRKEDELEKTKGMVDLDIRKSPVKYGLTPDDKGKVMESAIKASVLNDSRVVEAQEDYYNAYALAKSLEYSVKAFEQRKELLRGEGDLWINKYYSSITVREQGVNKEKIREDMHEEMGERIVRKRGSIG